MALVKVAGVWLKKSDKAGEFFSLKFDDNVVITLKSEGGGEAKSFKSPGALMFKQKEEYRVERGPTHTLSLIEDDD